jgi:hypothetical protein
MPVTNPATCAAVLRVRSEVVCRNSGRATPEVTLRELHSIATSTVRMMARQPRIAKEDTGKPVADRSRRFEFHTETAGLPFEIDVERLVFLYGGTFPVTTAGSTSARPARRLRLSWPEIWVMRALPKPA